MSTTIASDWHRLGAGLSVRFTLRASRLDAEWQPRLPTKREFKRLLSHYRAARLQYMAELARRTGGTVACVELGP